MGDVSRRKFIGSGAGAIVGGIVAVSVLPTHAFAAPPRASSALGVFRSAVRVRDDIFALITVDGADGVYRLESVGGGLLRPANRIAIKAPDGFFASSLGTTGGDLVVGGGRDSVWRTYEVDDDLPPELEKEFDRLPRNIPRGGRRTVVESGTVPHLILVRDGVSTQVPMRPIDSRAHEYVLGLGAAFGGALTVLLGHSASRHESSEAVEIEVATLTSSDDMRTAIVGRLSHDGSVSIAAGPDGNVVLATMVGDQTIVAHESELWRATVLKGPSRPGRQAVLVRTDGSVATATVHSGTLVVGDLVGSVAQSHVVADDVMAVLPVGRGSEVVLVERDRLRLTEL